MPANKRKSEDLQWSAIAVGQTKLPFKKQKSAVAETSNTCKIIAHFLMDLFHYASFLKNPFLTEKLNSLR